MKPLYDALFEMMGADALARLLERGTVEVAPLAFMRGRTLNNSFIILDEAQNTTPEQMKMFLTRLGFGSKAVVNGDVTQIDLPTGQTSGLVIVRRSSGTSRGSRWPTSAPETSFGTRSCRTSWRRTASSESSVPAPMVDDDQPPLIALDDRQDAAVDLEGLIASRARPCSARGSRTPSSRSRWSPRPRSPSSTSAICTRPARPTCSPSRWTRRRARTGSARWGTS